MLAPLNREYLEKKREVVAKREHQIVTSMKLFFKRIMSFYNN